MANAPPNGIIMHYHNCEILCMGYYKLNVHGLLSKWPSNMASVGMHSLSYHIDT